MKHARHIGWALCLVITGSTACGVPGSPSPPSLNLPQPVTDLRAVRKGNNAYLAWTVPTETTDFLPVRHPGVTRVCRSTNPAMTSCTTSVGEVAAPRTTEASANTNSGARPQARYTDPLTPAILSENPSAQIFYAVSVLNENGRSAGISNVVSAPAVDGGRPPADLQAKVTADGVVLTWTEVQLGAETSELRHVYRMYRREEGTKTDTLVGELPLNSGNSPLLVDHSFEWEKTYFYRATLVTLVHAEGRPESQFESDDTPAVKVFVHDIFPPAVPTGVQAVFSGAGQPPFIDLIWAPDTEADLAGYNVYRREEDGAPLKINSAVVKTPAFRDPSVASTHTYIYSVSAVDTSGNESSRSDETRESVP